LQFCPNSVPGSSNPGLDSRLPGQEEEVIAPDETQESSNAKNAGVSRNANETNSDEADATKLVVKKV